MKRSIAVILMIILTAGILAACNQAQEDAYVTLTGRFLKSDITDTVYIITDDNMPVELVNKSEDKELFDGLYNGDRMEIKCGPVLETYPGRTDVYKCSFIEQGNIKDIPSEVLTRLRELGRIK